MVLRVPVRVGEPFVCALLLPAAGTSPLARQPPHRRRIGADDLAKLAAVLRLREAKSRVCVVVVRYVLLTGCRPGKKRCLHQSEVRSDRLTLNDGKTGPRRVLLGEEARKLPGGLAGMESRTWVFSGKIGNEPLTESAFYSFWIKVDARLHDLRSAGLSLWKHPSFPPLSAFVKSSLTSYQNVSISL